MRKSSDTHVKEAEALRQQVIQIYSASRVPRINQSGRLIRGLNRASADLIEEAFADWLAKRLGGQDDRFLLGFGVRPKGKLRRFDIVWASSGIVRHVFEVKTDMGWSRDDPHYLLRRLCGDVRSIRGKHLNIRSTDAMGKEHQLRTLAFSNKTEIHLVLISTANSGRKWLEVKAKAKTKDGVTVYRLFKGHPNSRNVTVKMPDAAEINISEFKLLLKRLGR